MIANNAFEIIWLILFTIVSSEVILWLPIAKTVKVMNDMMIRSKKLLLSKSVSDNTKEKLLPVYATKLFISSIMLPLQLVLIAAPLIFGIRLFTESFAMTIETISIPTNLLLITVTSIVYIIIRIKWLNARLFLN